MGITFIARAADVPSARSSSPAMNHAHSRLAERQQNSRFQRSNIADVLPLAMLISRIIAAAPADIAPATSAARAGKQLHMEMRDEVHKLDHQIREFVKKRGS